ncbi:hypothetical protein ACTMU2_11620 [Cupriavidus basilensis]
MRAQSAYRTHLVDLDKDASCQRASANMHDDLPQASAVTPESVRGLYELHFVEFDDQGWLFPNTPPSADALATNPSNQIDNLMDRLTYLASPKKAKT